MSQKLMTLACTPEGQPLPAAALLMMPQPQLQRAQRQSAASEVSGSAAKAQAAKGDGGGGDRDASPFLVGVNGSGSVLQMRVTAGIALGQLAAALDDHAGV